MPQLHFAMHLCICMLSHYRHLYQQLPLMFKKSGSSSTDHLHNLISIKTVFISFFLSYFTWIIHSLTKKKFIASKLRVDHKLDALLITERWLDTAGSFTFNPNYFFLAVQQNKRDKRGGAVVLFFPTTLMVIRFHLVIYRALTSSI